MVNPGQRRERGKGEIPVFGLRSAVEACKQGLRRNTEEVPSIGSSAFRDVDGIQRGIFLS